jgi:uncharacterized RDD family membrane protein YckC
MMGKRILAYLIDVVIVLLASSMLSSISYLNPQLETYNKYYDEYSEKTKDYLDKKTADDEYLQITNDYSYKLERNSVYSSIISVVTILLYFGVFQKYNNGQTLGKKLLNIRVKGNLNVFKYLLRTAIIYNVFINVAKIILIVALDQNQYLNANKYLYALALVVEVTTIVMIMLRKDHKGLHDLIVGSEIVEENKKVVEV